MTLADTFIISTFAGVLGITAAAMYAEGAKRARAPEPLPFERCYVATSDWLCISRRGDRVCLRNSEEFRCFNPQPWTRTHG